MADIKTILRESRSKEIDDSINNLLSNLSKEGLQVEFGTIGKRTTYAMIHDEEYTVEIVGYTFLKDLSYYNPKVGKLKALQQAIVRKGLSESKKD